MVSPIRDRLPPRGAGWVRSQVHPISALTMTRRHHRPSATSGGPRSSRPQWNERCVDWPPSTMRRSFAPRARVTASSSQPALPRWLRTDRVREICLVRLDTTRPALVLTRETARGAMTNVTVAPSPARSTACPARSGSDRTTGWTSSEAENATGGRSGRVRRPTGSGPARRGGPRSRGGSGWLTACPWTHRGGRQGPGRRQLATSRGRDLPTPQRLGRHVVAPRSAAPDPAHIGMWVRVVSARSRARRSP